MSLVGPRPIEPTDPLAKDRPSSRRWHAKPGLASLAVIASRLGLVGETELELDELYVDHRCWWLDVKIMIYALMHRLRHGSAGRPEHPVSEPRGGGRNSQ